MKALVVDDDRSIRILTRLWLEESGYEVIEADSGMVAIQAFHQHTFDIILLDVEMPKINGFEVAKAIRGLEKKWVPIIFMSAVSKEDYYEKGIQAGADFYFVKPLNRTIFEAFLKGMIRMHHMRKSLENTNNELMALRDNVIDGIVTIEPSNLTIENINQAGASMLGYEADMLINKPLATILQLDADSPLHTLLIQDMTAAREACKKGTLGGYKALQTLGSNVQSIQELKGRHQEGHLVPIEISITQICSNERLVFIGIMRDISERRLLENKLKQLAQYDTLTGLPNRVLFQDRFEHALMTCRRNGHYVALMFVDLDRFKTINDTLGHNVGDRVLIETANRFEESLRSCDTVCRLAGDEFTIILENIHDTNHISLICEKLLDCLKSPMFIDSKELFVTASVGISVTSEHEQDAATMIKHADLAMYQAKEKGRNQFMFYTPELNAMNMYRLELSTALNHAIKRNEFCVYYQPQLDVRSNHLIGSEALLRWNNPKVGSVSPAEFIPLLEDTGLIVKVTEWILQETMMQWADWIKRKIIPKECKLSVNLSAKHFTTENLVETVEHLLQTSGLSPRNLVLEITESIMMANTEVTKDILHKLKKHGIRVSLDDFGTGYSSLSYLSQFPIDEVKIDKSFIDKISISTQDESLLRAIINMAKSLHLPVIAEGVDAVNKLDFLKSSDCDYYQGFLFSPALSPKHFEEQFEKKSG